MPKLVPDEKLIGIPVDEYVASEADPALCRETEVDPPPPISRSKPNPSMKEGQKDQCQKVLWQLPHIT